MQGLRRGYIPAATWLNENLGGRARDWAGRADRLGRPGPGWTVGEYEEWLQDVRNVVRMIDEGE